MQKEQKKKRRTNAELENDIYNAARLLIEEEGFGNVTLTGIAEKAGVTPKVFYSWFGDLETFFAKYTEKFDYWLNGIIEFKPSDIKNPEKFYAEIMLKLASSLYGNKSMQQILIWEISEKNAITRRNANLREINAAAILEYAENLFKDTTVDIRAQTALLIAGIYYTILRKDHSTFCGLDLTKEADQQRLHNALNHIVFRIFEPIRTGQKTIPEIVASFKAKGIDLEIIAECTGLTLEQVEAL